MAKLKENIKQPSPSWMVAATTILMALAQYGPAAVASLPGGVPQNVIDWLHWGFGNLAIVMGVTAFVSRSKSGIVGGRPDDRNKP